MEELERYFTTIHLGKELFIEESKLKFLRHRNDTMYWCNNLKELSLFYEIIKQTRFNKDFIEFCFSRASLLNESDKATIFDTFKNLFEIKPEDESQITQPPSKIKWNGTHEELCVY